MSENPFAGQGRVGIRLAASKYSVAHGGKTTINVTLRNQGLEDDRFALAVGGIPAAWVSSTQPVVSLAPGEQKETDLIIEAPLLGETETGAYNLTVRASSQQHPNQYSEIKVVLEILSDTLPSAVSIEMESAQIAVAPGSSADFSLQVKNNGPAADTLRLFVDGIPSGWVSTAFPVVELEPGEQKEIPVTISPPRATESRAGRHPITFRLVSQEFPKQVATQEGILTIGAFLQFQSELQPSAPVDALQNAQVVVTNQGNYSEAFQVKWESPEAVLAFELWQKEGEKAAFMEVQEHALKVEPGTQGVANFRAGLRQRPFIGGTKAYPFAVQVSSSNDDVQTHHGEITDRAQIPIWVIPLILVLCVIITCLGIFIYNWLKEDAPPASPDNSWARVQEAGILKVATSADYPPFVFYNEDFVIDGFDAALIRDIGAKLGVEVEIEDYAFEGLGATLNVGQADVAIAAISVTPEREALFDFSNIYYIGQDGVLARVNSEIESITAPADMAEMRVGVQQFTIYERWAEDVLVGNGIISQDLLFVYSKPEHAVDDLKNQRLDLVIMDLQPAILALSEPSLKLVGQGLNQQRFAIAVPTGAHALRAEINEALLTLQNEGRVNQLAEIYLGLQPEDIIPPPTPEPTPESTPIPTATQDPTPAPCVDAMAFVEDLNYDDEDLTNFPLVDPGQAFQKGWRIRNTGTCTWNSTYFLQYTHGNDPAAQMGGEPTAVRGAVEPGQTYDVYVDLIAPDAAGKYVGNWQLRNPQNQAFGQTVWVAVQVRGAEPEVPTATVTPQPSPTITEVPPSEATATVTPSEPTEEPGADLRDKTWLLVGYLADIEDDNLTEPIAESDVELVFEAGGSFEGNAGCNTFTGFYETNGVELIMEEVSANQVNCDQPAGIMEQESVFLKLLESAETYRLNSEGQLEIIREVVEDGETVKKVILLFADSDTR